MSGDKKTRVTCVFIAHSGLRIKTLGNHQGQDGLRIQDLLDIKIEKDSVDFNKIPVLVIVRRALSARIATSKKVIEHENNGEH